MNEPNVLEVFAHGEYRLFKLMLAESRIWMVRSTCWWFRPTVLTYRVARKGRLFAHWRIALAFPSNNSGLTLSLT